MKGSRFILLLGLSGAAFAAEPAPQAPLVEAAPVTPALPTPTEPAPRSTPEVKIVWGEGLQVSDPAHGVKLKLGARVQVRANVLGQGGPPTLGLQVRRARIKLEASHAPTRTTLGIQLSFSAVEADPELPNPLRDAWIRVVPVKPLQIVVGQQKVPYNPERVRGSSGLILVDRSVANAELNLDRDIGILFQNDPQAVARWHFGIYGGEGRNQTMPSLDLLYVARASVAPFGRWDGEAEEGELSRDAAPGLVVGASVGFLDGSQRSRGTIGPFGVPGFHTVHGDVDLLFKVGGLEIWGEGLLRYSLEDELTGEVGGVTVTQRGNSAASGTGCVSYAFPRDIAVSGRFSTVVPLEDSAVTGITEGLVGVGWYPKGHAWKWQTDGGPLWTDGALGWQLRSQVQLTL